jgi:hypothetical protein
VRGSADKRTTLHGARLLPLHVDKERCLNVSVVLKGGRCGPGSHQSQPADAADRPTPCAKFEKYAQFD